MDFKLARQLSTVLHTCTYIHTYIHTYKALPPHHHYVIIIVRVFHIIMTHGQRLSMKYSNMTVA